jgi:hypothetical protein
MEEKEGALVWAREGSVEGSRSDRIGGFAVRSARGDPFGVYY